MKKKRMTVTEKYMSMKRQAEQAGMSVTEKNGKNDLNTEIANVALMQYLVNNRVNRLACELNILENTSHNLTKAMSTLLNRAGENLSNNETQPIYQTLVAASLHNEDTPHDLEIRHQLQDWLKNEFDIIFK